MEKTVAEIATLVFDLQQARKLLTKNLSESEKTVRSLSAPVAEAEKAVKESEKQLLTVNSLATSFPKAVVDQMLNAANQNVTDAKQKLATAAKSVTGLSEALEAEESARVALSSFDTEHENYRETAIQELVYTYGVPATELATAYIELLFATRKSSASATANDKGDFVGCTVNGVQFTASRKMRREIMEATGLDLSEETWGKTTTERILYAISNPESEHYNASATIELAYAE